MYQSHIGIDFIDAWGERRTSFQLLDHDRVAVAVVHDTEHETTLFNISPKLDHRADAIHRLARIAINQYRREHSA